MSVKGWCYVESSTNILTPPTYGTSVSSYAMCCGDCCKGAGEVPVFIRRESQISYGTNYFMVTRNMLLLTAPPQHRQE